MMTEGNYDRHKTVGVVLVNWNSAELTIDCIKSLLCGHLVPDQIAVVDNASYDGSADLIAARFNQIKLIRNTENLGFAGGNNVGIQHLLKCNMDYIWVLNNDTEIDENCLSELVKFMDKELNVSGCCGKILYDNPRNKIWYAGSTFNKFLLTSRHRGALETDTGQYNNTEFTPFITGCSMFVRQSAWNLVGGFDEAFFAYAEDLDWCLRAMKLSQRFAYVPNAVIYHKVSSSFRKSTSNDSGYTTPLMIKLCHRNKLFIIRKYSNSTTHKSICLLLFFFWVLYYSSGLIILKRHEKLKSLWAGIYEGLN